MDNLFSQKVINANNVFADDFLDVKLLYLYSFNMLPSINFISNIDTEKTFDAIREKFADNIKNIHQRKWYKKQKKRFEFDNTIVILDKNCVLELDDNWCEILHDGKNLDFVQSIVDVALQFKEKQRRQPLEINLIVQTKNRLELKAMEIKRTKLDLDLFYEDDFKEIDETIRKRLNQKKDKGIVLLHGLPGTGKTTYLRHLMGKIKKKVMFLSPNIAGSLVDPEFIDLLIDSPNSVVIIEDAENIIMDRRTNQNSSVSNLLNISDGLLADFLNVQLICTFNSSLTMVDSALMRKGRLIAKYEFGKLSVRKAQRLSDRLGYRNLVIKPMTIAEITNPEDTAYKTERTEIIGFKRQLIEN